MKVLLVGGGGREHAILRAILRSPRAASVLCTPGNAGMEREGARCFPHIKTTDLDVILALARDEAVDFVIVAPDDPLGLGLVDLLEDAGIPAFGPRADAARIESSKVFSKQFMRKYNIPTAEYRMFSVPELASEYVREKGLPIVVKADGLTMGKGVTVAKTLTEANEAIHSMMVDKKYRHAGARVIIEECMSGPEVTFMCFTDGETVVPMPTSQDHKRLFDGDEGPNTGGMGAICPSPYFTREHFDIVMNGIVLPAIEGMRREGCPFKGVLYTQLMLTESGPRVIEFNARFGDPEAETVLPQLKSDLLEIMLACREGRLSDMTIEWEESCAACVAIASGGYPLKYKTGYPIKGLDAAAADGAQVYHMGTAQGADGAVLTNGGRVLCVTATGRALQDAVEGAYKAAERISFEGAHMRRDIGRLS